MFFHSIRSCLHKLYSQQAITSILPKLNLFPPTNHGHYRNFQMFVPITMNPIKPLALPQPTQPLLSVLNTSQLMQTCGFKVKVKLRKRCKDCYFTVRKGRKMVLCNTHPRHKLKERQKQKHNTWILTHATQSKIRPW